jgi:hypothetical protein
MNEQGMCRYITESFPASSNNKLYLAIGIGWQCSIEENERARLIQE